jgi:hypothetical protein
MADTTGNQPPEPQGEFGGIPYDWRPPTTERIKARWWNPDDRRLFTPKAFGWGYDLNLYWVTHPLDYLKKPES